MGLSSVSTALSSNTPTGLLVDCCCQFSSFSAVRIFWWLQFLKLNGYTAVQQNLQNSHRQK